jgi:ATP-dependent DNA helicase RecQ
VLKGEQRVMLRKQAEGRATRARAGAPAVGLDVAARALFERLRAWRADTARAHGLPAYVIFHDATLLEVARLCPRSLARLRGITGIGTAKLERYGESLLEMCLAHAAEHDLPAVEERPALQATAPRPEARLFDALTETSGLSLYLLVQEGLAVAEIAARRGLKESTIYGHLADAIACGLVEADAVLPLSAQERGSIAAALREQRASAEPRFKPVFERFEGRYDYGILKCVAAAMSREEKARSEG